MTAIRRFAERNRDWLVPAGLAGALFVVVTFASVGGLASHRYPGDVGHYETFGVRVRDGLFPYGAGFYLEYPPFSLPAFVLPEYISHAHYLDVFKTLMALCGLATVAVVARTIDVLDVPRRRGYALLGVVALAPLLQGHTYLNRYDPWAALLTSVSLLLFVQRRHRSGAVFLALSFAAKTYAAAIVPAAAIWTFRQAGRAGLRRATISFAATCAVVYGPFVVRAFGGLGNSYYTQSRRSLEIESLGATFLLVADKLGFYTIHWFRGLSIDLRGALPDAIGTVTSIVEVAAILFVAVRYRSSGRQDAGAFLTAATAAVTVFIAFAKVISPQYTVWLIALVPLVARRVSTGATVLLVLILLATQADATWGRWGLRDVNWIVWVTFARNLGLVALAVMLVRELRPRAEATLPV